MDLIYRYDVFSPARKILVGHKYEGFQFTPIS